MVDLSIIAMGDAYVVRYMRYRGRYPAKDFLDACDEAVRVRLLALAQRMAIYGRLPSDAHGHQLKSPYAVLFEFKPLGARVMAFFHGKDVYLTNGAPKRKPKAQAGDYDVALNMRADFYDQLDTPHSKTAR